MEECGRPETKDKSQWVEKTLLEHRTLIFSGSIDDETAEDLASKLLALDLQDKKKPITLVLNSGGGSISSGFFVFDIIRGLSAPLSIVGTGIVASMGVGMMLAVPKARRLALPNTRFMIHQPLIMGTMVGPASDVEINAREMVKLKDRLNQIISEETGRPYKQVEHDTLRDYWMNAEEAQAYGLVSRVITGLAEV